MTKRTITVRWARRAEFEREIAVDFDAVHWWCQEQYDASGHVEGWDPTTGKIVDPFRVVSAYFEDKPDLLPDGENVSPWPDRPDIYAIDWNGDFPT